MKKLFLLAAFIFIVIPVKAQTQLQIGAYWDNGSAISGKVVLNHGTAAGTVTDWNGNLNGGWMGTKFPLAADTLYYVTVSATNPSTHAAMEYKFAFIIPSLILDPAKVAAATYQVKLDRATNLPVVGGTQVSVTF